MRKNNARINEIKKGERSEKLNTVIKKTEVCLITKKKGLELNKAILDIACSNFQQEHDMDRLQCQQNGSAWINVSEEDLSFARRKNFS